MVVFCAKDIQNSERAHYEHLVLFFGVISAQNGGAPCRETSFHDIPLCYQRQAECTGRLIALELPKSGATRKVLLAHPSFLTLKLTRSSVLTYENATRFRRLYLGECDGVCFNAVYDVWVCTYETSGYSAQYRIGIVTKLEFIHTTPTPSHKRKCFQHKAWQLQKCKVSQSFCRTKQPHQNTIVKRSSHCPHFHVK